MGSSPTQILRYSFPGFLVSTYAVGCYLFVQVLAGQSTDTAVAPLRGLGLVFVGSVAVVIGVVMFQLYWLGYGPFFGGRLFGKRFLKVDRGRAVLIQLLPNQLDVIRRFYKADLDLGLRHRITSRRLVKYLRLLELDPLWNPENVEGRSPVPADRFAEDWHAHWDIVCVLVDHAASNTGETLRARHAGLSETYHLLGACRTAIGWGGGFALVGAVLHEELSAGQSFLRVGLGAALIALATISLCLVFHHARASTEKRNTARLGLSLRTYYAEQPDALTSLLAAVSDDNSLATLAIGTSSP